MKNLSASVCLLVSLVVAACATTPAKTFYPRGPYTSWNLEPKANPTEVQVLQTLPVSGFGIMGELALAGGPRNSFQEMLDIAQREAAGRGADFIVLARQQVQSKQVMVPGVASVQSSSTAVASVNRSSGVGAVQSQGSGYAVGPSIQEVQTGSMNFLLGKYPRVWLGMIFETSRQDQRAVL